MLVVTRKLSEQIIIGQKEIVVKVLEVRGGRVRIGIEAPREVRVERINNLPAVETVLPAKD